LCDEQAQVSSLGDGIRCRSRRFPCTGAGLSDAADQIDRAVPGRWSARHRQPRGRRQARGEPEAARPTPDGHTLLIVLGTTLTANPWLYKSLSFDPVKDFRPLSILTRNSLMLAAHPSVPASSVAELVAYAKQQPVSYAHAGRGSPGHLVMEYFRLKAGFEADPVPYRGNAPLVTDLLGGQIKLAFVNTAGLVQHVRDGRLKGLAISSSTRSELAPAVPTVSESGYPGFEVGWHFVMLAPAGVPDSVAVLLEQHLRAATSSPGFADKFRAQDIEVIGSNAAEARAFLREDTALWARIAKDANLRVD
jgi:tripartite-type tricarboxylate transporter receptor subunit TctC